MHASFEVFINDKIQESIFTLIKLCFGIDGKSILHKNRNINNDETFASKNILMNDRFLIMMTGD